MLQNMMAMMMQAPAKGPAAQMVPMQATQQIVQTAAPCLMQKDVEMKEVNSDGRPKRNAKAPAAAA